MFSSLNCDKLEEKGKEELESSHECPENTNTRDIARRKVVSPQTATCLSGHQRPSGKSGGKKGMTTDSYSGAKERKDVRPACKYDSFSPVPRPNPYESHFYPYL